jgi:ketosteroid isomerase-like protein
MLGLLKPAALNRSASVPVPTREDELQIRALMGRLHGAVNQKALPELLDMLADDVVLLSASGAPVVGRNAVMALCTDLYGRYNIRHQHELTGAHVIGKVAMNMGGYLTTLTPLDGGNTEEVRGRVVAVWRRENGTWKVARCLCWASWVDDVRV